MVEGMMEGRDRFEAFERQVRLPPPLPANAPIAVYPPMANVHLHLFRADAMNP